MTVQPFVDRNRSYKPRPWNVRRGLVAPEWEWAWDRSPVIMAPFWGGGSAVKPVGLQSVQSDGTLTGGISRSSGRYGRDLLIDNDSNPGFVDWGDAFSFSTTIPWTAVVLFRIEEIGTDERSWWCKYPADNTAEGRQLRWCVDTDGSIEFDMNSFTEIDLAPSGIVTAGEWFMGMIRCDPGADEGTQAFWDANGARLYSGTGTLPSDDSDNTKAVTLGSRADGGDNFLGDIAMGAIWGETLSLSLMDRLARDPFGPFRRQTFRKISVATGPQTFTRTLDDSFTQQETLNRDFSGDRILDDQQTLAENLTDAAVRNRDLSESFTFADTLIRDVVLTRLLSDSNPLTENLNRDFFGDRLLSDDETLTENLTRTVTVQGQATIRRISDTFTFAENLIRDQILTRLPTENFSLSENFRNLINGDVIGAAAARRFISQFSNFIEDQTLDDNVVTDFVDGIFS